ncbi:DMP19 family protein [Rufibacter immobilis]|uniref:DMP19 family protein n=1 Tax=Rufibacter immobilis TaxID=1348778 RepID=UPI0035E81FCD
MSKIDKILLIEDDTEKIIEIGQLLWEKSKNDDNFESLNIEEKTVLYIEMLESQVNNGGFDQYFFNSSGSYVHETSEALERINAPYMKKILDEAINSFPVTPVPKDTQKRRELIDDLPESISDNWERLDNEFYKYPDNLGGLVIEYVKNNKKSFQ